MAHRAPRKLKVKSWVSRVVAVRAAGHVACGPICGKQQQQQNLSKSDMKSLNLLHFISSLSSAVSSLSLNFLLISGKTIEHMIELKKLESIRWNVCDKAKPKAKLFIAYILSHSQPTLLFILHASYTRNWTQFQAGSPTHSTQRNLSPITNSRNINHCQMICYTLLYLFICWWRPWESNANELNVAAVFVGIFGCVFLSFLLFLFLLLVIFCN